MYVNVFALQILIYLLLNAFFFVVSASFLEVATIIKITIHRGS